MNVCEVTGCSKPRKTKGRPWCGTHLARWYRTGSVGEAEIRVFREDCSLGDCTNKHHSGGFCVKHYRRVMKHGSTEHLDYRVGAENPSWSGDEIGYIGAHKRIVRARGLATEYDCPCGESAEEWSYNHNDPDEKYDEDNRPYSPNPSYYTALCIPCHRKKDGSRRSLSKV